MAPRANRPSAATPVESDASFVVPDPLLEPAGVDLNASVFGMRALTVLRLQKASFTAKNAQSEYAMEADILFDLAASHDAIRTLLQSGMNVDRVEPSESYIRHEVQADFLALRQYHEGLAEAVEQMRSTRAALAARGFRSENGLDDLARIRIQHETAARCYSHALLAGVFSLVQRDSSLDDSEITGMLLAIYQNHAETLAKRIVADVEALPRTLARALGTRRLRISQKMADWKKQYQCETPIVLSEMLGEELPPER